MINRRALFYVFGYTASEISGKNISLLMPFTYAQKHNSYVLSMKRSFHEMLENSISHDQKKNIQEKGSRKVLGKDRELYAKRKNGDIFPIEIIINAVIANNNLLGIVRRIRDISEEVHIRTHDAVTNLLKKEEFEHQLSIHIAQLKESQQEGCILDINIDGFSSFHPNNYQGWEKDNFLLRKLAKIITSLVRTRKKKIEINSDEIRPCDTIAASSENHSFLVFLPHITTEQAKYVAERIRMQINENKSEDMHRIIDLTIGISNIKESDYSPQIALESANKARQKGENFGGGRIEIGDQSTEDESILSTEIIDALYFNRFQLFIQKIDSIETNSDQRGHFEVLLRLPQEDGKRMHDTQTLFHFAERKEINLAPHIDRWVVEYTFKWLSDHPKEVKKIEMCSINLSGNSLSSPHTLGYIQKMKKRYLNIPPQNICFEITETAHILDSDTKNRLLKGLKEMGFIIALDDYGVGNSSLEKLYKNIQYIDIVKIDGMLVRNLKNGDETEKEISRNDIRTLCHNLSLFSEKHKKPIKVIAEFVETEELKKELQTLGVHYFQGWGIKNGKPVSINDLQTIL